jgi:hypothetical protein
MDKYVRRECGLLPLVSSLSHEDPLVILPLALHYLVVQLLQLLQPVDHIA